MKKLILGLLAISVFMTSCDGWGFFDGDKGVTGKGAIERTTRDVKDFKSIDLANSANVFLKQGTTFKVEVETHKNIADVFETVVENGELRLQNKSGVWNLHYDKLNVYIEMPAVEALTLSGSGDIKVETPLSSEAMNLHISGSGNISVEQGISTKTAKVILSGSGNIQARGVASSEIFAKISGSGVLNLSGTSDKTDYHISGSGDIEAKDLKSKAVKALISGSGGISCHADESLDAEVTGSGNISYSGNAANVKSRASGSGSITKE